MFKIIFSIILYTVKSPTNLGRAFLVNNYLRRIGLSLLTFDSFENFLLSHLGHFGGNRGYFRLSGDNLAAVEVESRNVSIDADGGIEAHHVGAVGDVHAAVESNSGLGIPEVVARDAVSDFVADEHETPELDLARGFTVEVELATDGLSDVKSIHGLNHTTGGVEAGADDVRICRRVNFAARNCDVESQTEFADLGHIKLTAGHAKLKVIIAEIRIRNFGEFDGRSVALDFVGFLFRKDDVDVGAVEEIAIAVDFDLLAFSESTTVELVVAVEGNDRIFGELGEGAVRKEAVSEIRKSNVTLIVWHIVRLPEDLLATTIDIVSTHTSCIVEQEIGPGRQSIFCQNNSFFGHNFYVPP